MRFRVTSLAFLLTILFVPYVPVEPVSPPAGAPPARHVILMIADGWGIQQIEATQAYAHRAPPYQSWLRRFVTTYPASGTYDPAQAWAGFSYVKNGATDSAAAATALYTGVKTSNGNISVRAGDTARLFTITEKARLLGRAVGAVTTVPISHATPGAWEAHNNSRSNYAAIADEGYWGDPDTTAAHAGDHGLTLPPLDVMIGGGHPVWSSGYVTVAQRDKLAAESGQPDAFTFVERISGSADGGVRLLAAANAPGVTRLAGLFGGSGGNIEYRLADGSGHNPENPTLAEMTQAALIVLSRNASGFVLLVEGGAVDWAGHANNMNHLIGEMIGFDEAVQVVVDWVEDSASPANWDNTLVIVTGDHETGYLTAGPDMFPDQPLGLVSDATLALERPVTSSGRRASWDDLANPGFIDPGETVYWAWNSGSHTNSLVPLYARGAGAQLFDFLAANSDPVRGAYLDNTGVHTVMDAVLTDGNGIGELHWGTCDGQSVNGLGGTAVPVGSRVELWDVGMMPPRLLDTAVIGDGGMPAGQFADAAMLDVASYVLQVRIFDAAAPVSGAPTSCAVVAPAFDPDAPGGLNAVVDPFDASLICIDSAQIPDQVYAAGQGGCRAPLIAPCADFVAPWGMDVLDISLAATSWPNAAPADSVDAIFDLNGDQQISVIDLVMAAAQWGYVCL